MCSFFERRLKLVGGVRAEQTNVKAAGPLTDPTRNFQRDAARPDRLERQRHAGADRAHQRRACLIPSSRTSIAGRTREKEYLRYFPSLNASYNVRENLIARAAYLRIGRPARFRPIHRRHHAA